MNNNKPTGIWAILGYVLIAMGSSGAVALFVLNLLNPDFTEMRMFFEFWPIYVGSFVCMGLAALFLAWGTPDGN